jgi:hypothetical protein
MLNEKESKEELVMANNNDEYRKPAGKQDSDFEIININLAKSENVRSEMKSEQGPRIGAESIISTTIEEGVKIQAYTTEREGATR